MPTIDQNIAESGPLRRDMIFASCLADKFDEWGFSRSARSLRHLENWDSQRLFTALRRARRAADKAAGPSEDGYKTYIESQLSGLLHSPNIRRHGYRNGKLIAPTLTMLYGGASHLRFRDHVRETRKRTAILESDTGSLDVAYWDAKVQKMAEQWGMPVWTYLQTTLRSGIYDAEWIRTSPLIRRLQKRRLIKL